MRKIFKATAVAVALVCLVLVLPPTRYALAAVIDYAIGKIATAIPGYAVLIGGSDGTNLRAVKVNTSGQVVTVGAGTAGTPAGGVVTVQGGDTAGTPGAGVVTVQGFRQANTTAATMPISGTDNDTGTPYPLPLHSTGTSLAVPTARNPTRTATAPTQCSVATSATQCFTSTAGICTITIQNESTTILTVGQTSAVTDEAKGVLLKAGTVTGDGTGGSVTFDGYGGDVYVISHSGTVNAGVQPTACP